MNDDEWQAFAAQFGFGLMATSHLCGSQYNMKNTNLLLTALQEMADCGLHPEIVNVPLILLGSSNAGTAGYSLVNLIPDKILCGYLNVPAGFDPGTPTVGGIKVPAMWSTGENDFNRDRLGPVVANARGRGGLWAWVEVQGMAHEQWRVYHVGRAFYEKCIELRYPQGADVRAGPVQLNEIAENSGWLGSTDWRNGLPEIRPCAQYPLNKSQAQWFVDEDIAFLSSGLTNWNDVIVLDMYVDGQQVAWDKPGDYMFLTHPGAQARLVVTPQGFAWNRLEFYRGATKIGEVTSGAPELTFTLGSQSIAQSFTVVAHSAGDIQMDAPYNVQVWDAGTSVSDGARRAAAPPKAAANGGEAARYDLRGRSAEVRVGATVRGIAIEYRDGRAQAVFTGR
jgi:hypothetical protein